MRMLRLARRWAILCVTPLLGGCIINLGGGNGGDDRGTSGGGTTSGGDPGRQARTDEVNQYIAEDIYKGAPVTQSLQLASGDVVDAVDRSAFPDLPYALPALPWSSADVTLPPGVTLGVPDVDQIPELADLASKAAVFRRPDFSPYILGQTDATSVQDYLDRYEEGGATKRHVYAGLVSDQANRGVTGYMNQFQPEVEVGTFSLIEFAVGCPAVNPTEMVGVVISVDNKNLGGRNEQGSFDGLPRLHVEYAVSTSGKMKYTWDELDGAFVANPFRQAWPGKVVPVSVLGGAQVEHLLTIFQSPGGDWWIAYDQELLGYYPAKLFTMLNEGACESRWYGEVFNPHPDKGAIKTEMGSGKFAAAGLPNVAYVRSPKYYDTSWFSVEPKDTSWAGPYEISCYTRLPMVPDPVSGGQIFSLGGPGGKDPGCQWP